MNTSIQTTYHSQLLMAKIFNLSISNFLSWLYGKPKLWPYVYLSAYANDSVTSHVNVSTQLHV